MELRRVLRVKRLLSERFLGPHVGALSVGSGKNSVIAVGVTTYLAGEIGVPSNEAKSLVVLVGVEKLDKKTLSEVPAEVDGVRVVVEEIGRQLTLQADLEERIQKLRPFPGGVSIGTLGVTAGTAGCLVYDRKTGEPLLLSNNHVIVLSWSDCRYGEQVLKRYGKIPVLQPGLYDIYNFGPPEDAMSIMCYEDNKCGCLCTTDVEDIIDKYLVGHVHRYLRVVSPSEEGQPNAGKGRNLIDAAVARLVSPDIMKPEVLDLGIPGPSVPAGVHLVGRTVLKSGRTTGLTAGTVRAVHVDVKIWLSDTTYALFTDQIMIVSTTTPFAKGGDSGSVVVLNEKWGDGTYKTCGLLFAGSNTKIDGKWIAVANTAKHVEELLDIRFGSKIVTEEAHLRETARKVAKGLGIALPAIGLTYLTIKRIVHKQ